MYINDFQISVLIFGVVGALFIILSIPLIQRRVPPNAIYGVRTTKTLSNKKLWYDANHFFGKDLLTAGLIIATASIVAETFEGSVGVEYITVILLSVMILSLAFAVFRCYQKCQKAS